MLCLDGKNRRPKIEKVPTQELLVGDYVHAWAGAVVRVIRPSDGVRIRVIYRNNHAKKWFHVGQETNWYGSGLCSRMVGWRDR